MVNIIAEVYLCENCMFVSVNGECGELDDDEPEPLSRMDNGSHLVVGPHEHHSTCTESDRGEGCDCGENPFALFTCAGCGVHRFGAQYDAVIFDS